MRTITILLLTLTSIQWSMAQSHLEVLGKAQIIDMPKDNTADSVVVRLADGTLAVRDVSTLTEFQILSIGSDTIYLSNGGYVVLPPGFDGQYSSLSGAPTNVSAFMNDAGYLTMEVDGSVTNELQTISRTGLTVTLSDGGGSYMDSVNVYTAGSGISITNNVISSTGGSSSPWYLGQGYPGRHRLLHLPGQRWHGSRSDRGEDGIYGIMARSYVIGWCQPELGWGV